MKKWLGIILPLVLMFNIAAYGPITKPLTKPFSYYSYPAPYQLKWYDNGTKNVIYTTDFEQVDGATIVTEIWWKLKNSKEPLKGYYGYDSDLYITDTVTVVEVRYRP